MSPSQSNLSGSRISSKGTGASSLNVLRVVKSPGFYRTTRSLHLYAGLFVSPLLLIFCISVFFINHSHPINDPHPSHVESRTIDSVPASLDSVASARAIMKQVGLSGWVTFFRLIDKDRKFRFIVLRPTERKNVTLDLASKTVEIETLPNTLKGVIYWLHVMPGPHTQYRNWSFLYLWWALADSVAYGALFLGVSGIYLWYFLKKERRIGLVLLTLGVVTFLLALVPLLKATGRPV